MCGIVGFIGKNKKSKKIIESMTNKLIHRGPDDFGYYVDEIWSYSLSNNSEGCQLIGAPGFNSKNKNTYPSEYLSFCKAECNLLGSSRSRDISVTGEFL